VFRQIVARNLRARGREVHEAETAHEALTRLSRQAPDLILLDINLPDRSGWDLLRQLQAQGQKVPVIIVSAVRVGEDRLSEFKPLAYLPKPFALEALLRLVENGDAPKVRLQPVGGASSRRHCVSSGDLEIAPVLGLSQVLTACDLLLTSAMTTVTVSIASTERDADLIALSQEAADDCGVSLDRESRDGALILRFTRAQLTEEILRARIEDVPSARRCAQVKIIGCRN